MKQSSEVEQHTPPLYVLRDIVRDDLKAVRIYAKASVKLLDSDRETAVMALENYRRAVRQSIDSVDVLIAAAKAEIRKAERHV